MADRKRSKTPARKTPRATAARTRAAVEPSTTTPRFPPLAPVPITPALLPAPLRWPQPRPDLVREIMGQLAQASAKLGELRDLCENLNLHPGGLMPAAEQTDGRPLNEYPRWMALWFDTVSGIEQAQASADGLVRSLAHVLNR